jgi:hypothetical protein
MTIHAYNPKPSASALTPLPIAALAIAVWNLLDEASDLPQPRYLTVSDMQRIGLQFPADRSSFRSITRWALRFSGVITSTPINDDKGPRTLCAFEFDYYGIRAEAYAVIPA